MQLQWWHAHCGQHTQWLTYMVANMHKHCCWDQRLLKQFPRRCLGESLPLGYMYICISTVQMIGYKASQLWCHYLSTIHMVANTHSG